jgi:hypothetical protein
LLKEDIAEDRKALHDHGALFTDTDINRLKAFDKYANMKLNSFNFTRKKQGKYIISKWENGDFNNLRLYQVESTLPSDTIYKETDLYGGPTHILKLKKSFVKFRTYIIFTETQKQLIYTRQIKGRLTNFQIDGRKYSPVYEDIALGVNYPNEQEILRLIAVI